MARNTMQQAMLNKSRADKFLLVFDIPPILKDINKNFTQDQSNTTIIRDTVQFSIYGAAVPAITVAAEVARYAGSTLHVSSHSKDPFPPVTVNFKVDNNFWNYWVIYSWLNLLNDHETSQFDPDDLVTRTGNKNPHDKKYGKAGSDRRRTSLGILQEYSTNMTMWGLDEYNNKSIQFDYIGAFPTSLDSISYNYQEPEEIDSRVAFSFSRMTAALL